MTSPRNGDDRGFLLPATLVAITLMAFAALLTGRTIGVLLRASVQESLAVEEHATVQTVTGIIDSWMADQQVSTLLQSAIPDPRIVGVWRTPQGADCVWGQDTTCWKIDADDPSTPENEAPQVLIFSGTLRGGEAQRQALAMTATVVVGCYGSTENACQRTRSFTRNYERAVFAQYQLHYDTNAIPPLALNGPDGQPNDPAVCGDPDIPPDPMLCDDVDPATVIVFTGDDNLNGPLRTTLTQVLYCGNPTFSRVEVSGNDPDPLVDAECGFIPTYNSIVYGGDLQLPQLEGFSLPSNGVCSLDRIHYAHPPHTSEPTSVGLRGDCPGDLGNPDHAITDGDIISAATGDIIIEQLILEGSVTIYAEGDIIICGDIIARGNNSAGGPNVIALISEGDVILDPSGFTPPACGDDTILELNTTHNLTLTRISILAPNGAIYAQRWYLPHASTGGPTLTIEGSIAAKYLGLYATPDRFVGVIDGGWSKTFTYPPDFWQARPPWWPGLDGSEWAPIGAPGSASDAAILGALSPDPDPGMILSRTAVTVTESTTATETFTVTLTAQPLANVTVQLDSLIFFTIPSTLRFTPTDWDTPQTVVVDASTYHNPASIDIIFEVTLTTISSDGNYDGLSEMMHVTVADNDIHDLVLTPGSLSIDEAGSGTFTVSLSIAPSAPVTMNIASRDTTAATIAPAILTFDASNYDTAMTVTVTGVNDNNTDDETLAVSVEAVSTDTGYDGLTASLAVSVTDDDMPVVVVSPDSVTADENGTATFLMRLATQPSDSVTVSVIPDDITVATPAPSSLTFTTVDWSTPQIVTVTGTDDADINDDSTRITVTASNGGYDGVTSQVDVVITDDDEPPFTADEAESYVEARDCLILDASNYASDNNYNYQRLYLLGVAWCSGDTYLGQQGRDPFNPAIPLGQDDPNALPRPDDPQGEDDLRDAIDALAIAAGLTQDQIDTAES